MAAPASKLGSSRATQVFSQPGLEELVLLSVYLSTGEGGCPATAPDLSPP